MLDYGMDPQAALDDPRGLHYDGLYSLEQGVPEAVVEGLRTLGHRTHRSAEPYGGGQMIWIDWENGGLVGASDPRKDGCALGY
jgi:gamma-glutamyltranspeptidase/glutathione hydrolase